MAFDNPPFVMDATTPLDGEVIRRALGSLLNPAGGVVTPGDLTVAQQTVPNMSIQISAGQIWVPGTSTPSQGPYYSRNGAAVTLAISAADPSKPRVDTIIAQAQDAAYAGVTKSFAPAVVIGTPTTGVTVPPTTAAAAAADGAGTVPASSLVLAYVLVPAAATSIVTANIANVVGVMSAGLGGGASIISGSDTYTGTSYGLMGHPDQVPNLVLPSDGVFVVAYQATWQESVGAGASRAAIFLNGNQLKANNGTSPAAPTVQEASGSGFANSNTPLATQGGAGLVGGGGAAAYTGDVTTGQLIGATLLTGVTTALGGAPCVIFAAAGTYTISVQFKASSGTVTVSNRRLYAKVGRPS